VLFKPNVDKDVLLRRMIDAKTKKYISQSHRLIFRFKQNVIHYDNVLDTVTFHYGDFNSLLVQGKV